MRSFKDLLIDILKKEGDYLAIAKENGMKYSVENFVFEITLKDLYIKLRFEPDFDPSKDATVIQCIQDVIVKHPEFLDGFTDDEKLLLNMIVI